MDNDSKVIVQNSVFQKSSKRILTVRARTVYSFYQNQALSEKAFRFILLDWIDDLVHIKTMVSCLVISSILRPVHIPSRVTSIAIDL